MKTEIIDLMADEFNQTKRMYFLTLNLKNSNVMTWKSTPNGNMVFHIENGRKIALIIECHGKAKEMIEYAKALELLLT